jgi:hypothetical protein
LPVLEESAGTVGHLNSRLAVSILVNIRFSRFTAVHS